MCTAVAYTTGDLFFGRTLDHTGSYGETVTVTPRHAPLRFRRAGCLEKHHAMIGMGLVRNGYPLYYDGVNEAGLCMAGLHFTSSAVYGKPVDGKDNLAHFELIPWILGQCRDVKDARQALERIQVTDDPFSAEWLPAKLHWMVADRNSAITVESVAEGLRIYENPVGVLTNEPPFPQQLLRLNDYLRLSNRQPEDRFCIGLPSFLYSYGLGVMGLPGDWSSQSRFVRAAFTKAHSVCGTTAEEGVSQFFHILGTVTQPRGCTDTGRGFETTVYTSCCHADRGIYYYKIYENHGITGVSLWDQNPDGDTVTQIPLQSGTE